MGPPKTDGSWWRGLTECGPLEKGMANHQYSCLENPMNSMVMTNLDNMLKSRDITLPTKVHLVKAMVFPVVMYGCESWTVKKAECQRIDAFELWCWGHKDSDTTEQLNWTGPNISLSMISTRSICIVINARFSYFLWLNNILLHLCVCIYIATSSVIHLSMETQVVSMSWPLWFFSH